MGTSNQDTNEEIRENEVWVLVSTILASSMAFIMGSALNVAMPAIQSSLNARGAQLLWLVNGYMLMLASLILVCGALGDRLGRKKVFMTGVGLFTLASLGCGLSPSINILIGMRVIQGIGGALMIPGSLATINTYIAPDRRGKAIGTWSAATTLVTVIGPVLGGVLADIGFWRGVFLINLPLGLFSFWVLYTKLEDSRDESLSGQIDFLGAGMVMLGLGGLTYGFISAPEYGFDAPRVFTALAVGVASLVFFIWLETKQDNPILPLHLFKSSTFSGTNLLTLFLYAGLSVTNFFLSLNLVQTQGYTQSQSGLALLPFVAMLTLMSRWAGGLVDKIGPRMPLTVGPLIVGIGFFWLAFSGVTEGPSDYWTAFFPGIFLFGVGMGFTVAPLTTSVMGAVEDRFSGVASGINNAISRTAGTLGVAIVGSVALIVFSNSLEEQTLQMNFSDQTQQAVMAEAEDLGGASVPEEVPQESEMIVARSIDQAFADTFRVVMFICTGLAWISVIITQVFIRRLKR